jgi:hypothetical protein
MIKSKSNLVKLVRASSLPVLNADFAGFQHDFGLLYDKIMTRFPEAKSLTVDEDIAKRVNYLFERCQARLFKKYPIMVEVKLPSTKLAWKKLLSEYQEPVVVAQSKETLEPILIIQDR